VDGAVVLAEKIRAMLEQNPVTEGEYTIGVTASFGVTAADVSDGRSGLGQVLTRADRALYAAKQAGRNRVERSTPVPLAVMQR
jgi:diguanylate cyclase (GGDEF)-like protein